MTDEERQLADEIETWLIETFDGRVMSDELGLHEGRRHEDL